MVQRGAITNKDDEGNAADIAAALDEFTGTKAITFDDPILSQLTRSICNRCYHL